MSKPQNNFAVLLLGLAVALGALSLRAPSSNAGDSIGYSYLRTAPVTPAAHTIASSADATTWGVPLNAQPTLGNPDVVGFAEFDTASATCAISCGLYYKLNPGDSGYVASVASYVYVGQGRLVSASATATGAGSGVTDGAGLFPALAQCVFDTGGAPYYDLRIGTPSSGQVSVKQWCYGLKSQ